MHHFAQHDGRFVQSSMSLTTLASRRIDRCFPQTIVQQDKATVRLDAELRHAKGLGAKIETDEARCDGHGLRFPNPKTQIPDKFQALNLKHTKQDEFQ